MMSACVTMMSSRIHAAPGHRPCPPWNRHDPGKKAQRPSTVRCAAWHAKAAAGLGHSRQAGRPGLSDGWVLACGLKQALAGRRTSLDGAGGRFTGRPSRAGSRACYRRFWQGGLARSQRRGPSES